MKVIKIFIIVSVMGFLSCEHKNPSEPNDLSENAFLICEAEDYDDTVGEVRVEEKPNASCNKCVHLGPDSDVESEGIGDALIYNLSLEADFSMGVFEVWYSDDVGGNIIHVHLDDQKKGCFRTETTGGWNDFELDRQKMNLDRLSKGSHTLKMEMTKGGSWGVLLDYFKITGVEPKGEVDGAYDYIKSLINRNTGLVRSADYDKEFTTVYKNALAAMAFIHENDLSLAEGIFDFFKSKYDQNSFRGFNKNWNSETGNELAEDYWEGDNAFLLLALNYYIAVTGSFGDYKEMVTGLRKWLSERADEDIIAEGLANMYTALKPFENCVPGMDSVVLKLKNRFNDKKDYQNVLDHIMRGALCFSDISGFDFIDVFKRTEIWEYDGTEVNALAGFSWESLSNVEISAQILLAWKIWKSHLSIDLSFLEKELNDLWLLGTGAPGNLTYGLPYFLSDNDHGWLGCYDEPIIDPTCYMLFYYWDFNPMAPGRKGY
ncbi:MAG: hypothetical protein WBC98_08995 [Candidatus Zixiibacteriota bacterium]